MKHDKNITRQAYLDGKITHQEFYAEVVKLAGIKMNPDNELVKMALNSTDPNLNDIPLRLWDNIAYFSGESCLRQAFKQVGDFYSLAGGVCAYKEAVRQAVEKIRKEKI